MQRVLIVACILAALVLSAFKPARGENQPRDGQYHAFAAAQPNQRFGFR
jgi:hypothetical protein